MAYESEARRNRRKDDWRYDEEPGTTLVPVSRKDSITGTWTGVEEPGTTAVPMSPKEQTTGTRAGDQESGTASVSMLAKGPTEGTHADAEAPDGNGTNYAYELRWALTGALIKACVSKRDVSVEQLEDQLDGGYFEEDGVPPAIDDTHMYAVDHNGDGFHYTLIYGTRKLESGQFFSDYSIPSQGATINVIKETADPIRLTDAQLLMHKRVAAPGMSLMLESSMHGPSGTLTEHNTIFTAAASNDAAADPTTNVSGQSASSRR